MGFQVRKYGLKAALMAKNQANCRVVPFVPGKNKVVNSWKHKLNGSNTSFGHKSDIN
jgi:hypothetical protein